MKDWRSLFIGRKKDDIEDKLLRKKKLKIIEEEKMALKRKYCINPRNIITDSNRRITEKQL